MKSILLAVCFACFSLVGFGQSGNYQLSSHILDISKGAPAAGVPIRLEKMDPAGKSWLSFYPFVEIVFEIKDNSHYHVPIALSAFGYSTYRGN